MTTAEFTTLDWILFCLPVALIAVGMIVGFISEMWFDN